MFFDNINYWAIIASAIVSMAIGFAWYSPYLFSKWWMQEMKHTPEELEDLKKKNGTMGMARMYAITILSPLITAFVISALLNSMIVIGLSGLLLTGFLLWLAFSMPVSLNYVLFGRDSLLLFAINSGYQLAAILITSLIVGIFG